VNSQGVPLSGSWCKVREGGRDGRANYDDKHVEALSLGVFVVMNVMEDVVVFPVFFFVFFTPSSGNAQKRDKRKIEKKPVLDFLSIFL
jgi:hypothetical protein